LILFFPGFVPGSYRTISLLSIRFIVTHLEIRGLHSIKNLRNTIYNVGLQEDFGAWEWHGGAALR
jgi:hypothetical protein